MQIDMYGREDDQDCQQALEFFQKQNIYVNFFNTEQKAVVYDLIQRTRKLQKESNYKFIALNGRPYPIIIVPETQEVVVGFFPDSPELMELNERTKIR